jgi:hypothetical protein
MHVAAEDAKADIALTRDTFVGAVEEISGLSIRVVLVDDPMAVILEASYEATAEPDALVLAAAVVNDEHLLERDRQQELAALLVKYLSSIAEPECE